jgi:hypothetical protein
VEHFKFDIENELLVLERYKLEPTELFAVKVILLAQQEGEYEWLQRFAKLIGLRKILVSLQEKEIILKSYKIPKEGETLEIEDIPFNKNFLKNFYKSSFEMGEELFNAYPQTCTVGNQIFNLKRVSKKFDSLEQAFTKYGKYIKFNPETHEHVLELISWGIENGYSFTTLDSFIIDMDWKNIESIKDGNGININTEAIKMI